MTTTTLRIPRDTVAFHRVDTTNGDWSSALVIKADRRLTSTTAATLASLVGYAWTAHVRAENLCGFERVGHDKIVFWDADTTKTVRDDLGDAWGDFLDALPTYVREGSPVRVSNRRGAGTAGTRLVEGLGADWTVEVYADAVLAPVVEP